MPPVSSISPPGGPDPRWVIRLMAPPSELGPRSEALPLSSSTLAMWSSGMRSKFTSLASGSFCRTPFRKTETPCGVPSAGLALKPRELSEIL